MNSKNMCPCCGLYEHTTPAGGDDICPICKWEDNGLQREQPDYDGAANKVSLNQARILFSHGKDTRGNLILLPLFLEKSNDAQRSVQVMANCRLVMQEGRAGVLV